MKKLIIADGIRAAYTCDEQEIPVVLRASIITPETHEVTELLGVTISECGESASTVAVPAVVNDGKTESQHIRETIIAQSPGGQFTESLVAQLTDRVMEEKQSLGQGGMQPSFSSATGKGGVKVINGSNVKSGRSDGAQSYCVGLTDLVTDQDGSSMAAGFTQWGDAFSPWTLNYNEIDMILRGELHVRHEGETVIAKTGDVILIPKGSSIESGASPTMKLLYVAWPVDWQSC